MYAQAAAVVLKKNNPKLSAEEIVKKVLQLQQTFVFIQKII